jgi:2-C-methyl-D-erythritol 4-phosphate cytidylyltransferase/2-C-methyl-D-erythritol 2,4-cyclodiphosphate synthase
MTKNVAAVVVAGGRGLRAGGDLPKQYRTLGNVPVLRQSLAIFAKHEEIRWVQPVIHRDDGALYAAAADGLATLAPAFGGATRQASVRAGLEALAGRAPAIVLVHDAARPFTSPALVSRAIAAAADGAAIPGVAMTDTIKEVDADGHVRRTLDRTVLRGIQTPQAFGFDALLAAHRKAHAAGREDFTDDAALAEWAGMTVGVFAGEAGNV